MPIEALNVKRRRAVRARGHFPSDDAATKLLFLVLNRSEKQWIMPPREWSLAKAQCLGLVWRRRGLQARLTAEDEPNNLLMSVTFCPTAFDDG